MPAWDKDAVFRVLDRHISARCEIVPFLPAEAFNSLKGQNDQESVQLHTRWQLERERSSDALTREDAFLKLIA